MCSVVVYRFVRWLFLGVFMWFYLGYAKHPDSIISKSDLWCLTAGSPAIERKAKIDTVSAVNNATVHNNLKTQKHRVLRFRQLFIKLPNSDLIMKNNRRVTKRSNSNVDNTLSGLQKLLLDYRAFLMEARPTNLSGHRLATGLSNDRKYNNSNVSLSLITESYPASDSEPVSAKTPIHGFKVTVAPSTATYSSSRQSPKVLSRISPSGLLDVIAKVSENNANETSQTVFSSLVQESGWNPLLTHSFHHHHHMPSSDRKYRFSEPDIVTAPTVFDVVVSADMGLRPETGDWTVRQHGSFKRKEMELPKNSGSSQLRGTPSSLLRNPVAPVPNRSELNKPISPTSYVSDHKSTNRLLSNLGHLITNNSKRSEILHRRVTHNGLLSSDNDNIEVMSEKSLISNDDNGHVTLTTSEFSNRYVTETTDDQMFLQINEKYNSGKNGRGRTKQEGAHSKKTSTRESTQQSPYSFRYYPVSKIESQHQGPAFIRRDNLGLKIISPLHESIFFRQDDSESQQEAPMFFRHNPHKTPQQSPSFRRNRPVLGLSNVRPVALLSQNGKSNNDSLFLRPGLDNSENRSSLRKGDFRINITQSVKNGEVNLPSSLYLNLKNNLSVSNRTSPVTQIGASDTRESFIQISAKSRSDIADVVVDLDGAPVVASTFFPLLDQYTKDEQTNKKYQFRDEDGIELDTDPIDNWADQEISSDNFKLTTEYLAYILIGSCCGLSVVCLVIVAVTVRCRKLCIQRKLRHVKKGDLIATEAARFYRQPYSMQTVGKYTKQGNECSCPCKNAETCTCTCTCDAWSTGIPNLQHQPFQYPRYSRPRKLPFGAASTLHFETLGINSRVKIKRTPVLPRCDHDKNKCGYQSSYEAVSADTFSTYSNRSRCSAAGQQCSCIGSHNLNWNKGRQNRANTSEPWVQRACMIDELNQPYPSVAQTSKPRVPFQERPKVESNIKTRTSVSSLPLYRRAASVREAPSRYSFHSSPLERTPESVQIETAPVSGSNYLNNSNEIIFWSSNSERLI